MATNNVSIVQRLRDTDVEKVELGIDVEKAQEQVGLISKKIAEAKVTDPQTNAAMIDLVAENKRLQDNVEKGRKMYTDPLNRIVKRINNLFHPLTQTLEADEKLGKRKINDYRRMAEEAAQKERERLEREYQAKLKREEKRAEKKGEEPRTVAPPPVVETPVPTKTYGSSASATMKEYWKFTVENPALIPEEYKIPDEKKIRAAVNRGVREIPGIRIYPEQDVAISA